MKRHIHSQIHTIIEAKGRQGTYTWTHEYIFVQIRKEEGTGIYGEGNMFSRTSYNAEIRCIYKVA